MKTLVLEHGAEIFHISLTHNGVLDTQKNIMEQQNWKREHGIDNPGAWQKWKKEQGPRKDEKRAKENRKKSKGEK